MGLITSAMAGDAKAAVSMPAAATAQNRKRPPTAAR
jgi:hypothetical protein